MAKKQEEPTLQQQLADAIAVAQRLGADNKQLQAEVERLKMMLEPEDCGHLHTTINVLEHRIVELRRQRKDAIFKEFASVMK